MKADTNKNKGKAGLALAIGYYGSIGYTVSLPLNDTQDYDLIVDDGQKLNKVQVRCTGQSNGFGGYHVSVRSCGGTKGTSYSHVKNTDIDFLFVVCTNGWMFEIPKKEITQSSTISLYDRKSKYSSNTTTDYSQYLVSFTFKD